jgi:hypothetical protein
VWNIEQPAHQPHDDERIGEVEILFGEGHARSPDRSAPCALLGTWTQSELMPDYSLDLAQNPNGSAASEVCKIARARASAVATSPARHAGCRENGLRARRQ